MTPHKLRQTKMDLAGYKSDFTTNDGDSAKTSASGTDISDIYSFFHTFDPNEISPEPPLPPDIDHVGSGAMHLQAPIHGKIQTRQPWPSTENNDSRIASSNNELHKISSAIAASELSSNVIQKSNSFNSHLNPTSAIPPINQNGSSYPNPIHNSHQHHHHHHQSETIRSSSHSTNNSQTARFHDAPQPGESHSIPTADYSRLPALQAFKQGRPINQNEQHLMMNAQTTSFSDPMSGKVCHAPMEPRLQNATHHINRYPAPTPHSHQQPTCHSSGFQPRRDVSGPRASFNIGQGIYSGSNHNVQQNNIHEHRNSHCTSVQHSQYPGNLQRAIAPGFSYSHGQHNLSHDNHASARSHYPSYLSQQWPNSGGMDCAYSQSIAAASRNLINNSIIYKQASHMGHMPSTFNVQPQNGQAYPNDGYKTGNYATNKSWDYKQSCNLNTDIPKNGLDMSKTVATHNHIQQNHTLASDGNRLNYIQYERSRTQQNASNQTYPNIPKSTYDSSKDGLPVTHQNVDWAMNHGSFQPNNASSTSRKLSTDLKSSSSMRDLIKITDQVLNNEIKFSCSSGAGDQNDLEQHNTHPPSNVALDNATTNRGRHHTTTNSKNSQSGVPSGTLCYNCGAFVSSPSVADELTTIAICHNCKEVLYFVTDDIWSKGKKTKQPREKSKTTLNKNDSKDIGSLSTSHVSNQNQWYVYEDYSSKR